jgi:predicted dehydrogenase
METLIHDFDALRYLNPGAAAVDVYTVADALVRPDFKDRGLLDTAVVTVRFDTGRSPPPRPASRPSTATTSAARRSARPAW